MEQLGSDQAMEEKVLESYKHKDIQFRRSWKLEHKKALVTTSLHSGPALVTPLDSRWDRGAVKPSGVSLRPLIGNLAVFRWVTTCLRARHGAGSWDCTSGEYLAADAERVTGLCSGQRLWGEENKNGRRDWNTDDGVLTLSVPAQILPEFKAFVGC